MMVEKLKDEPVLVTAVVQALLTAAVAFGLHLTEGQIAAVLGLSGAVLALVARSQVTPTRKTEA